jgi:hypothetical protein
MMLDQIYQALLVDCMATRKPTTTSGIAANAIARQRFKANWTFHSELGIKAEQSSHVRLADCISDPRGIRQTLHKSYLIPLSSREQPHHHLYCTCLTITFLVAQQHRSQCAFR